MRGLKVRYRRTIFCHTHPCKLVVSEMGNVSEVFQENGRQINAMDFDFGSSYSFDVDCPAGHRSRLNAPRDVQLVRGPASAGAVEGPPVVLRVF